MDHLMSIYINYSIITFYRNDEHTCFILCQHDRLSVIMVSMLISNGADRWFNTAPIGVPFTNKGNIAMTGKGNMYRAVRHV